MAFTLHGLPWPNCATPSTRQLGRRRGPSSARARLPRSPHEDLALDTGSAGSAGGGAEDRSNPVRQAGAGKTMQRPRPAKIARLSSSSVDQKGAQKAERSVPAGVEGERLRLSASNSPAGSVFLPAAAVDIPFPECLRLVGDSSVNSMSSVFRMALICCVVAQWLKIAGALTLWASRLRLKYFDSPLVYKNSTKSSKLGRLGVFWDLENCPVPSGCDIPTAIDRVRAIANSFGEIQCFRAYGKLDCLARQTLPFLAKGVELCPVPDGKEAADKAIILDACLFAFDHKPCPDDLRDTKVENDMVVIVTGDRGFAALLRGLRTRNITTIVIGNAHQPVPAILSQSVDHSLRWDGLMINDDNSSWPWYEKLATKDDALDRKHFCDELSDHALESRGLDRRNSNDVDCYQLDASGSELLCTPSSEQPSPLVFGLPRVVSGNGSRADRTLMKSAMHGCEVESCETADGQKFTAPIGGKIRVLRHLRYEVAAIAEKYCKKGAGVDLHEFMRLYELEMGHCLVAGHYGFGSLLNLLESMPDLVSLRPSSKTGLEILPFYPKGRQSYGRINYTRADLRCILYELLRTTWPYGVKKEDLSRDHARMTGRPFVLVSYEFLRTGDVLGSMRDLVYIHPRTKTLHLVDGAEEPPGYDALAQSHWS